MKNVITYQKLFTCATDYASKYDVFENDTYIGTIRKTLGGKWYTAFRNEHDYTPMATKAEAVGSLRQSTRSAH